MKRTQRAKDYAVIGELASRLLPLQELEFTTDPDRLLTLAPAHGAASTRVAVGAARAGDRDAAIVALARERDAQQRADRARVEVYAEAAERYLTTFIRLTPEERRLPAGHLRVMALAEQLLPTAVPAAKIPHADAE